MNAATGAVSLCLVTILCNVWLSAQAGQKCLYCDRAENITDCATNIIECGDAEECFLEKVTTQQLRTAFNAGCRSKSVCALMQQLGQGRKRDADLDRSKKSDYTNCVECCDLAPTKEKGPCNANLCGEKGVRKGGCLVCNDLVRNKTGCTTRQICQDTEVCSTSIHIVGGDILYGFFCEERHICALGIANNVPGHVVGEITSKRANSAKTQGLVVCSACCYGNDCNQEGCLELKKKNITVDMLGTSPTLLPTVKATAG